MNLPTDEQVCRILGWAPRHEWMVSRDKGQSGMMFSDRAAGIDRPYLQRWVREQKLKFPEAFAKAFVYGYDVWPNVTTSDSLAREAMEETHAMFAISYLTDTWEVADQQHESFAMAVCMAIVAQQEQGEELNETL